MLERSHCSTSFAASIRLCQSRCVDLHHFFTFLTSTFRSRACAKPRFYDYHAFVPGVVGHQQEGGREPAPPLKMNEEERRKQSAVKKFVACAEQELQQKLARGRGQTDEGAVCLVTACVTTDKLVAPRPAPTGKA